MTLAKLAARGDEYLISKFGMLQKAALVALSEIDAIPENARADEEHEAIQWALAPVERYAHLVRLIPASTKVGALIRKRVADWHADGDGLDCLFGPMEIAA
ncbi:hypothetical protein [Bradyrhizobium sp. 145]|uniref:hypothetical protein n=1 Tax=Bradyrhizobium sp. 145 TaxID=2782621 RepID=UPI001FFA7FF1|nr:hypothetical protein [Bradyrhizobium sp. 145]MCK1685625.1 hypothetical protein [Bradyrhizobium sp. 145]